MSSAEGKGYLHFYHLGRTAAEQGAAAEAPADLGARDRDAWLLGHRDGTSQRPCPTCQSLHPTRKCFYVDFLAALGPLDPTPEEDRLLRWLAGWDSSTRDAFVSLVIKLQASSEPREIFETDLLGRVRKAVR